MQYKINHSKTNHSIKLVIFCSLNIFYTVAYELLELKQNALFLCIFINVSNFHDVYSFNQCSIDHCVG